MEICHCWRLKRAAHHLNEFYDKALAPSGVTISQYGMLREINQHGGCSVMDLAGYLDLERSTLTRSLKPLMQKGFVSDCRECHMRNCRLVLTAEGHKAFEEAHLLFAKADGPLQRPCDLQLWQKVQAAYEAALGTEGVRTLETLLSAIQQAT